MSSGLDIMGSEGSAGPGAAGATDVGGRGSGGSETVVGSTRSMGAGATADG